MGVLSILKGLSYPVPQISAQVPALFALIHWPILTELREMLIAAGHNFGPLINTFFKVSLLKMFKITNLDL